MSTELAIDSGVIAVDDDANKMFVTMRLDSQLFGVPVGHVRDVLLGQSVTSIPLAPGEVAGSLNLRGRIVTVINMRNRMNLSAQEEGVKSMFVVVEHKNELCSLMVDSIGDILTAPASQIESVPANLNGSWKAVASGIYKLPEELLIIVDVETLLNLEIS